VRRALISSAAILPAYFVAPAALAQQASPPTADAGPARTIMDTNGEPGEPVTLQGSGATTNGTTAPLLFVWTTPNQQQIATGPTPTVTLPDGINQLLLTVTDTCCSSSGTLSTTAMVTITVRPPNSAPVANAGPDQTIADTDREPGELVTLDASASTDADGTITSYEWFAGDSSLGTGRVLTGVRLPDGTNVVELMVTDDGGNTNSDEVLVTVGEPSLVRLDDIAQTRNQKAMARTLDDLCVRLSDLAGEDAGLTDNQRDLLDRCDGVLGDSSIANQRRALDELGAQDFAALRMPTVVFAQTNYQTIMDRLVALRAGQRGASLTGLNLTIGDQLVSLEQVAQSLQQVFGGGASSDEPGGLLENRLGLWMRGNYGVGERGRNAAGIGFESDQWGMTGGVDYRIGQAAIAGVSLGYGKSDIDFNPTSQGGIETISLALSAYGSAYVGGVYLDGVLNYIDSEYDSTRHISYVEAVSAIERTALGSTGGETLSGGGAIGYDFIFGGFTFAPSVGYYYVDTSIDEFTERGAGGLDLVFTDQNYKSSTANAGVRASYVWNLPWGVFIPHFRGTFVREFEAAADVFGVRFANDPFASSTNPTPPIIVEADRIDRSYFRLAAGASAQFKYDISGYFEYQRLEGYEQLKFHDFTVGLRMQRGF